jgi:hypothetical protein
MQRLVQREKKKKTSRSNSARRNSIDNMICYLSGYLKIRLPLIIHSELLQHSNTHASAPLALSYLGCDQSVMVKKELQLNRFVIQKQFASSLSSSSSVGSGLLHQCIIVRV